MSEESREVTLRPGNIWRVGLVVLGLIALGATLRFVIEDGGSVIFMVLIAWFAAQAMAPVVNRLARRMRRGFATILVMLAFALLCVAFVVAFGALLVDQVAQLVSRVPDLIDSALEWVNSTFALTLTQEEILAWVGFEDLDFAVLAASLGPNILGFVSSVLGSFLRAVHLRAVRVLLLGRHARGSRRWLTGLFPPARRAWCATCGT